MRVEGRRERTLTNFPVKPHFTSSLPTLGLGSLGTVCGQGGVPRRGHMTTTLSESFLSLSCFQFPWLEIRGLDKSMSGILSVLNIDIMSPY